MTLEDIEKYIAKYDHRLTPTLCLAIALEAARREREACAETLENHPSYDFCRCVCECTEAIRARGVDL